MPRSVVRWLLVLSCTLLAAPLAAQTATVEGTVKDSAGAPVAGATVTVQRTAIRAVSGASGRYVLRGVPAGEQTFVARAIGFSPVTATVEVAAGTMQQDFTLPRAAVQIAPMEVVVGSRARHTAAEELAVPVDVFQPEQIQRQGSTETSQILQSLSPSVNFPRQSIADADDIVRPFTLRGLSPDHTLVLVNGVRRHRIANVHIFAYGMAAGSTGVDLNALPSSAIGRMEVLRDGASAQYGSDAIAGVVNLVIKDGVFAPYVTADAGQYLNGDYPNDGTTVNVNGGWGFKLGKGTLGLFAEYRKRNPTNRAWADNTDQVVPGDADSVDANTGRVVIKRNPVDMPNYHWGDGAAKDLMTFANLRYPVNAAGTSELYAFGGWSFRQGTGNGFRRTALDSRNWPQIYPLGFLPTFAPDVHDASAAAGIRGVTAGWNYDLGGTFGRNGFKYNLKNTLNSSLGPCLDVACAPGEDGILGTADDPGIPNKTDIFAGQLDAREAAAQLSVSKGFDVGLAEPLNVAFGMGYRREYYKIRRGELASYVQGFYPDANGDLQPAGSQVFAGFQPADEVDDSRGNFGSYLDVEAALSRQVLANAAARFEDYSDFGSRVTGKLALRYQPQKRVVFRAAASTGFRAPTLSQRTYSSRTTTFVLDTQTGRQKAIDFGIFPVASAPARALGAQPLKYETAVNLSGGVALTPVDNLTLTVDAYYIRISNRIGLTGLFATDSVAAILANAGLNVGGAQYFTNGLKTKTYGVDVTANLTVPAGAGTVDFTLAANYGKNRIISEGALPAQLEGTGVTGLFDVLTRIALEKERPEWRGSLTGQYTLARFHGLARASSYGKFTSAQLGACDACAQTYGSKTLVDVEVGYKFGQVGLNLGARNIFDTYPDKASLDNGFGLFPYPAASPFGYNGRFVYARTELTLF